MGVTFILGRAGAGKTHYCLSAVLSELTRPAETRRLVLLVPEQASFQMERALATRAPGGGYWRAEVLSFSRLARRVFAQTGTEPNVLSAEARALALRAVVARSGGELRGLRKASRTSGFFVQLNRLIEELLREDVSPEALREAAERVDDGGSARKAREVAQLYAEYLAWLGPERVDAATRLAVLRERLAGSDWLRDAAVWVDGFAGFTGQELQTLVALARTAREVAITLLLDPAALAVQYPDEMPDALGLFQRTETTYQRLLKLFAEAGIAVSRPIALQPGGLPRFVSAPGLAALEAGLATPAGTEPQSQADVSLCECVTHRDELRAAARWIRTRIADAGGGLHFRDFAVIARDLEPFAQLVAEVFAEYEIPYFLDRRRPMGAHPLSRLMPALFDAVQTDCSVAAMVRLLRTRLLPLSRDEAEQLENIVVGERVQGLDVWRRPAWELERAGNTVPAYPQRRAEIVQALEPLVSVAAQASGATGATWARTLLDVLERLGVRQQIEAWIAAARTQRRWESVETHRLAWSTLCEVLQDLHDVLGDTLLSAADVASIIGASLSEMTLGLAPPTVDQVLVSSIERSRHPDIKHAWVFAFNEGVFPASPAEDVLLSTAEREALAQAGLEACASHREDVLGERLLAYIALTRPACSLTISYATVADDGGALLPSPLLADVTRALPGLTATRASRYEPPVTVAELARNYLSVRRDDRRVAQRRLHENLCEHVRGIPSQAGTLDWLLRGLLYKNEPQAIGNFRRPMAGEADVVWDGSPSEVETFLQCPFKHFATFGLRLDAARGPRPVRWDLGSVAHEVLADVTRRAMREPAGVRRVADARWQELLAAAVQDFRRRQPADQAQRRPDLVFLGGLLDGFLRDVVGVHAERWRRGQFEPAQCEKRFHPRGADEALRGVALELANGQRVHLHGQIDRVDAARVGDETFLVVYDYKSSGVGPLSGEFLTGGRLQLFIYLLAVQQALAGDPHARVAGVFLAPLYPDLGILGNRYAADTPELEQTMYMYRPRGLVDVTAAPLLDNKLGTTSSPVASLQLKQDGSFYANCDAKPAAKLDARLELARRTVLFATEGIARGAVDVAPLVEKRTLACRSCDFQAVCRFDPAYNPARPAETTLPQLEPSGDEEGAA